MRAFIDQLSFRTRVVVVICIVLSTYVILVFDFDAEHHLSAPARPGGVASAQSDSDRPFQSRLPTATFWSSHHGSLPWPRSTGQECSRAGLVDQTGESDGKPD